MGTTLQHGSCKHQSQCVGGIPTGKGSRTTTVLCKTQRAHQTLSFTFSTDRLKMCPAQPERTKGDLYKLDFIGTAAKDVTRQTQG